MKKELFFEKYILLNTSDADDGKISANVFKNKLFVKSIEIPKDAAKNDAQAASYISSKIGTSWDRVRIFEGRGRIKTVENPKPSKGKNNEPAKGTNTSGAGQGNQKKYNYAIHVQTMPGGLYRPVANVVLDKPAKELSSSEIKSIVNKKVSGKWIAGSFVNGGYHEKHFYNKNEKQDNHVGAVVYVGTPI